jgi:hypothetical protein
VRRSSMCSDGRSSTCSNSRSAAFSTSSRAFTKRVSNCPHAKGEGAGGRKSQGLLPYVPKAWEVYVLIAIPMAPFILVALFLGPLLLED